MLKDPLYRKILTRLEDRIDPIHAEDFEACMGEILRHAIPGLVAVRGGNDAGMDGAIADGEGEPYPLVCTTSDRLERNLAENLDAFVARGLHSRKVALATSRRLTPGRRRKLQALARERGFVLVQIFEQRAVAARLYRDSRWRRDLLGVPGSPSALSVLPLTRRPMMDLDPVGREADLRWLREIRGDGVLTGEPGSGKTFLLRHLMLRGWAGLFLASDDEARVADALRDQRPRVVVVDDAHVAPHRLDTLRHLRQETGARFDILATTWNGASDPVAEMLGGLPRNAIRKLELLTRDEILEVFRAAGVEAPDEILRRLVDQAANKPGLAVTIAGLCLQGAWPEILTGRALSRTLLTTFRDLVGEDVAPILAAFSLGGEAGMDLEDIGQQLGLPPAEIWLRATRLAAGGVLFERGAGRLAVRPSILRSALLREVFFPETGPGLTLRPLLARAPHRDRAIEALVQARLDGVRVPDAELRELVSTTGSRSAWAGFAASSEENARWALAEYPKEITDIAGEALRQAPEVVIPLLLDRAVGTPGTPEGRPDHPMRILAAWVRELDEYRPDDTIRRRRVLARSAENYLRKGGDFAVGVHAICLILSPACESSRVDPGAGRTVHLRWAGLSAEQISEIASLWESLRGAVPRLEGPSWQHLSRVLWEWIHPEHALRSTSVPEEVREPMTGLAAKILRDLSPLAEGSPALVKAMRELGERVDIALGLAADPDYEILFPADYEGADFESWQSGQLVAVRQLASRWSQQDPQEVVDQLLAYEQESRKVARSWPRRTPDLCRELALSSSEPETWAALLIEAGAAADLVRPFLESAIRLARPGWVQLLGRCLASKHLDWLGMELALRSEEVPDDLLASALEKAPGATQLVETLCLRNEVPSARLSVLLDHPDAKTALAAAVGEWLAEPEQQIRDELLDSWREAILRSAGEEDLEGPGLGFWLGVILAKSPGLALDWLRLFLRRSRRLCHVAPEEIAVKALSGLSREERARLLEEIQGDSLPPGFTSSLIGRDEELYRQLLALPAAKPDHLDPLGGSPDERWLPLALAALDHGYGPADIASAAAWPAATAYDSGTMSDHWRGLDQAFARLESHERTDIQEVAREGRRLARQQVEYWEKVQRERAVHRY